MADYSLVDYLQGREPSTYIAQPGEMLRHARAFGAGLVDPMGLSGYAARGVSHLAPQMLSPEAARSFSDRMSGYRDESPVAAGMASTLIPGMGALRLAGATAQGLRRAAPLLMGVGGSGGALYRDFMHGVSGQPGFGEFSDVWNQGGKDLARYYMDVTRGRTSAAVQPLDGAPY